MCSSCYLSLFVVSEARPLAFTDCYSEIQLCAVVNDSNNITQVFAFLFVLNNDY